MLGRRWLSELAVAGRANTTVISDPCGPEVTRTWGGGCVYQCSGVELLV